MHTPQLYSRNALKLLKDMSDYFAFSFCKHFRYISDFWLKYYQICCQQRYTN